MTDEERDRLVAPITQDEVERAISDLKAQKAPGLDGFSSEFYKIQKKKIPKLMAKYWHKSSRD